MGLCTLYRSAGSRDRYGKIQKRGFGDMKAKGLVIGAALVLALSAPVKADPIFDDTSGIGLDTSGTVFIHPSRGV